MNNHLEALLFRNGKWWVLRHFLFWLFVYLDEILFTFLDEGGFQDLDVLVMAMALDLITVYLNLYLFIPLFLNKKRYLDYVIISLASVCLNVFLVVWYTFARIEGTPYIEDIASSVIATATLLATAVAIKIGKYSYEQLKYTEALKFEQSKLELNYLKQQINPHFLFNVLNTIHIQSKSQPDSVSDTVLHLSDLLRYQIYDAGSSETVPLIREIEFLKNYIALEQLRRTNLSVEWISTEHLPKIRITPFLFLPLIENAFKHSRSITEDKGSIIIKWESLDGGLLLEVSNSIGDAHEKEEGGFGIDNLRKRLDLIYTDKYELEMNIKDGVFISSLKLMLDESHSH